MGEFGIHFNDAEDLDSKAVVPYVSGFAAAGGGGTVSCVGFQYSDGTQLFHGDLTDCNSNGLFYLQNAQEVVTSVDVLTYEIDRSCGSGTNWQTFVRQIRITTSAGRMSTAGNVGNPFCPTQNEKQYTLTPSAGNTRILGFAGSHRSTGSITSLGVVTY